MFLNLYRLIKTDVVLKSVFDDVFAFDDVLFNKNRCCIEI